MKALIRESNKKGDISLKNVPIPKAHDNWVVIKICYAGICGSDIINNQRELLPGDRIKPPIIIGHEGSGIITEVGPNAKNVKVGQKVCFHTRVESCGECYLCKAGATNLCKQKRGIGSTDDGTMAEYLTIPDYCVIPIPDNLDFDVAALLEPLACCVHIVKEQGRCTAKDNVAVIGVGAIGMLSAITAKYLGAKVTIFGTNRSFKRAIIAKNYDINVFCGDMEAINKYNDEKNFSSGYDIVFDCAGTVTSFNTAISIVNKNGKIVLGAAPIQPVEVSLYKIFGEQISILSGASQIKTSWFDALEILLNYNEKLKPLVIYKYSLQEWEKAFEASRNRLGVKILIKT